MTELKITYTISLKEVAYTQVALTVLLNIEVMFTPTLFRPAQKLH